MSRKLILLLLGFMIIAGMPTSAAEAKNVTVKVNCRIGGKLYFDQNFLGVVLEGYQYPIHYVKPGEHHIRIEAGSRNWEKEMTVLTGQDVIVDAELPPPTVPKLKSEPLITTTAPRKEPIPSMVDPGEKAAPTVAVVPPPVSEDPPEPPKTESTPTEKTVELPPSPAPKLETLMVKSLGLELIKIKAGTFRMGDDKGSLIEKPVHTVTISRDFWIGKTEVTQAQYKQIITRARLSFSGDNKPMAPVQWTDAILFCRALNKSEAAIIPPGYEFRLPTDAEWEYACRAGTNTPYYFGEQPDAYNEYVAQGTVEDVATKKPNAWGLYNMAGNVYEWVMDAGVSTRTAPSTYVEGVTDPIEMKGRYRIMRGGSYHARTAAFRSSFRTLRGPDRATNQIGFRIVLGPVMPLPKEGVRIR